MRSGPTFPPGTAIDRYPSGVLVGFGSVVAVLIIALMGMDALTSTNVIVGVLGIPQYLIDLVYIVYMKKMIAYFLDNGELCLDEE